ncbi:MAG: PepSY domain-containing protein [Burkholderiaceae bacterium]
MKFTSLAVVASTALVFTCSAALADKPPTDIKKLSEIVIMLEKAGFDPISEIDFDDGHWEVDAYRNGEKREVHVDPKTGEITKDKKDD